MNNKIILILALLLFPITLISAQSACNDENLIDIEDIPCIGLTNIITCGADTNVSVINLNTSVQVNLTTELLGDGRFNFTFDFNESSYSLVDCANNTATVIVGKFEQGFGTSVFFFILPLFLVSFISLLVSSKMGKKMMESEDGSDLTKSVIHKNAWIPTIILIFSFLPILITIVILKNYLEQFIPSTSLISFMSTFYIFFLILFFFISFMLIVNLVSQWITLRKINMGEMDKEWK